MSDITEQPPKHVLFNDTRTGDAFVMQVPSTSPWFDLLPQHQEVDIRPYVGPIGTPRP